MASSWTWDPVLDNLSFKTCIWTKFFFLLSWTELDRSGQSREGENKHSMSSPSPPQFLFSRTQKHWTRLHARISPELILIRGHPEVLGWVKEWMVRRNQREISFSIKTSLNIELKLEIERGFTHTIWWFATIWSLICKHELLQTSMSDVSKPKNPPLLLGCRRIFRWLPKKFFSSATHDRCRHRSPSILTLITQWLLCQFSQIMNVTLEKCQLTFRNAVVNCPNLSLCTPSSF